MIVFWGIVIIGFMNWMLCCSVIKNNDEEQEIYITEWRKRHEKKRKSTCNI